MSLPEPSVRSGSPRPRDVPEGLCLDTGALIAIERRDRRVLRLLELARENGRVIDIPSAVVAQAWRGGRRQVTLARFLRVDGVSFVDLGVVTARAVGELCGLAGGSDVVDAHVALHALHQGLAVVTSDPGDIGAFAQALVLIAV